MTDEDDKSTADSTTGSQHGQEQQERPVHPSRNADTHPDQVIKGGGAKTNGK